MEPKSLLPYSQEPATGPYPEPDESCPHLQTLFIFDPFVYNPPIYYNVSQEVSSHKLFRPKSCTNFSPPHVCYMITNVEKEDKKTAMSAFPHRYAMQGSQ
jgi:hypothetical protein